MNKFIVDEFISEFIKSCEYLIPPNFDEQQKNTLYKNTVNLAAASQSYLIYNLSEKIDESLNEAILKFVCFNAFEKNIKLIRQNITLSLQLEMLHMFTLSILKKIKEYEGVSIKLFLNKPSTKNEIEEFWLYILNYYVCSKDLDRAVMDKLLLEPKVLYFKNKYLNVLFFYFKSISIKVLAILILYFCIFTVVSFVGKSFIDSKLLLGLFLGGGILLVGLVCYNLWSSRKIKKAIARLKALNLEIRELANPYKFVEKTTVDLIQLRISKTLIKEDEANSKFSLPTQIILLRKKLAEIYGYILPSIRVVDDENLEEDCFELYVRDKKVYFGKAYLNKVWLSKNEFSKLKCEVNSDVVERENPLTKEKGSWVDFNLIEDKSLETYSLYEFISQCIEFIFYEYPQYLMTFDATVKMIEIAKNKTPYLVDKVFPDVLSEIDLKNILIELIKNKTSIKDFTFILEGLLDFARETKNPDELASKISSLLIKKV